MTVYVDKELIYNIGSRMPVPRTYIVTNAKYLHFQVTDIQIFNLFKFTHLKTKISAGICAE